MIGRKTARLIAEIYENRFSRYWSATYTRTLEWKPLYDFLFDNEYDPWFCNAARATGAAKTSRNFKEFVMQLHTGESLVSGRKDWSWEQRQRLGQRYLESLAEDMLQKLDGDSYIADDATKILDDLGMSLELDGYEYRDSRLIPPETDILDVAEKRGILRSLYAELSLRDSQTAFHHLDLSEEHYLGGKWDDSISNSRKFLECVLEGVAVAHAGTAGASPKLDRPTAVRAYLEDASLLTAKEREALNSIYGLLSETGAHPYMARNDQARLLRHLALVLADFVMLRLKGSREQGT